MESIVINSHCLSNCTNLQISGNLFHCLPYLECYCLSSLEVEDEVMSSSSMSTLTLTNLPELQHISFGRQSCSHVTWFQLDLPHLSTFSVAERAFYYCQQLLVQFLPALIEFTIKDESFAETALIIYCISMEFFSL